MTRVTRRKAPRWVRPRTIALTRADRARIGALVEELIALLDADSGDPDLEDGDLDRCLAADDGPVLAPDLDRVWRDAA